MPLVLGTWYLLLRVRTRADAESHWPISAGGRNHRFFGAALHASSSTSAV